MPPKHRLSATILGALLSALASCGGTSSGNTGSDSTSQCGSTGQSCCNGSCNSGNACIAIGAKSQCEACGQPGEVCCSTEPPCQNAADVCSSPRGALMYCIYGTLGVPTTG